MPEIYSRKPIRYTADRVVLPDEYIVGVTKVGSATIFRDDSGPHILVNGKIARPGDFLLTGSDGSTAVVSEKELEEYFETVANAS